MDALNERVALIVALFSHFRRISATRRRILMSSDVHTHTAHAQRTAIRLNYNFSVLALSSSIHFSLLSSFASHSSTKILVAVVVAHQFHSGNQIRAHKCRSTARNSILLRLLLLCVSRVLRHCSSPVVRNTCTRGKRQ